MPLHGFRKPKCCGWRRRAERYSEHPLGQAIVEQARALALRWSEPAGFRAVTGHGVEARIDGLR